MRERRVVEVAVLLGDLHRRARPSRGRGRRRPVAAGLGSAVTPNAHPVSRSRSRAVPVNVIAGCRASVIAPWCSRAGSSTATPWRPLVCDDDLVGLPEPGAARDACTRSGKVSSGTARSTSSARATTVATSARGTPGSRSAARAWLASDTAYAAGHPVPRARQCGREDGADPSGADDADPTGGKACLSRCGHVIQPFALQSIAVPVVVLTAQVYPPRRGSNGGDRLSRCRTGRASARRGAFWAHRVLQGAVRVEPAASRCVLGRGRRCRGAGHVAPAAQMPP